MLHMLTITVGLPGCGKTTWARNQDAARVNRDDLRFMMFGNYVISRAEEQIVTVAQQAMVKALLHNGQSVIVDDTNLHPESQAKWKYIARDCAVQIKIKDMRHIPIEECKKRVAQRVADGGRNVPDEVIDRMAKYM